jgi:cellobiose-specific phosphotransferase system component IIA
MNKVIDDKIMETKRTLSQIHSVQHLVTLTLDAGDDSETTTALMIASKIAEDKVMDAMESLDLAEFEIHRVMAAAAANKLEVA